MIPLEDAIGNEQITANLIQIQIHSRNENISFNKAPFQAKVFQLPQIRERAAAEVKG
jgi:hypothetical protein